MDKGHLRLICGDPEEVRDYVKNPVSFTRFVFPFAYRPQNKGGGPLFYKEVHIATTRKRKYFTRETGNALYDRAKWLQVPTEIWEKESLWATGVTLKSLQSGNEFQVAMSPPMLVLFEWDKEKHEGADILKTGFLVVELWFPDKADKENSVSFDDLLDVNELFRCFDYPEYESHWERFYDLLGTVPTTPFSKDVHGRYERICDLKSDIHAAYFKRWGNLLSIPVKVDGDIYRLIPEGFTDRAVEYLTDLKGDEDDPEHPERYLIYNDYRAYVWSAAVLKDGCKSLGCAFYTSQTRPHEYGHWVKFLNVDAPHSGSPTEFEKEWAKDRTYRRWEHLGTWYGFNYHAGVAVMKPSEFLSHFREIYFDMALQLLYLRVTLFRFSNKLAEIAAKGPPLERHRKDFKRIRGHFSMFTIRYQYPLLSNQQQCIEMYEIARRHFDIEDFYKEVKSEIDGTHEYLEMVQSTKLSNDANILAEWGIPLAVAAVVTGLFGMNWKDLGFIECFCKFLSGKGLCMPDCNFWILAITTLVTGIVSFTLIRWSLKRKHDKE